MRVEDLAEEVYVSFVDICTMECNECDYSKVAPSCVIWYAYDYLSNNGYLRGAELDKDNICNTFYRLTDHETLGFIVLLIRDFVKYLDRCGYLKGVE